jgi:hypothetical protein
VFKRFKIKHAKNIVNFDKTRTRIGYTRFKDMIVLIEVMELYKASLKNRKSITICKAIRVNGNKPPPLYIIVPGKKVIKAWVIQELISEERIRLTIIRYINNEITLKYLDYLILHLQASLKKP